MTDPAATLSTGAAPGEAPVPLIRPAYAVIAAAALIIMTAAIVIGNRWFLTYVHVMAGLLWTGIDLFMGFIVGPALRRTSLQVRRSVMLNLLPRTVLLMPTLSIVTGTSGWFLAVQLGYLDLGYPEFWWVIAALVIITILSIQGLGYLLPTNIKLFYIYQRPDADPAEIGRVMGSYIRVIAVQGTMQVAIIVVMTKFGSGL
ncbi:MAG: hypothetical protein AB7O50_13990 [Pseudolabrys sp.]